MLNTQRYGRKIRKKYKEMQELAKQLYECPKCGKRKLKRVSFAIFKCKSCKVKVAGAAYQPYSEAGKNAIRIVTQGG